MLHEAAALGDWRFAQALASEACKQGTTQGDRGLSANHKLVEAAELKRSIGQPAKTVGE